MDEKTRDLLRRSLQQMRTINGPADKCVLSSWRLCPNHVLIFDLETFFADDKEVG